MFNSIFPENDKIFNSFNNDCSSIAISGKNFARIISFRNGEPETLFEINVDGIEIIERVFTSSFVVLVASNKKKTFQIYHCESNKVFLNQSFKEDILAVNISRQRLVVCLAKMAFIYSMSGLKVTNILSDLAPKYHKICVISKTGILALPDKRADGFVAIYDCIENNFINVFKAHRHSLVSIVINQSGTKIATASEIGTIIRIFSVRSCTKLFEFRRGFSSASIDSLAFNENGEFVCCTSNTETVHVFKLENTTVENSNSWNNYLGRAVSWVAPSVVDFVCEQRSFATFYLPRRDGKTICGFAVIDGITRVMVASTDGYLHIYDFDENVGYNCSALKIHRLI